jgi:hypothetical protein
MWQAWDEQQSANLALSFAKPTGGYVAVQYAELLPYLHHALEQVWLTMNT